MLKILIIEGETSFFNFFRSNLHLNGLEAMCAENIKIALKMCTETKFDLILANTESTKGNSSLHVLEVPVIFYHTKKFDFTSIQDHLRKIFDMNKFRSKTNHFLKNILPEIQLIEFGSLFIDPAHRIVTIMGKVISLGKKELHILTLLAKKSGEIVTRENILDCIYENSDLYDRTVDSHISHLRKKMRMVTGDSLKIISVYGLGYKLQWTK
jgi:DNA-binding response OmpR family regulator